MRTPAAAHYRRKAENGCRKIGSGAGIVRHPGARDACRSYL